jgi:hypothetical protein
VGVEQIRLRLSSEIIEVSALLVLGHSIDWVHAAPSTGERKITMRQLIVAVAIVLAVGPALASEKSEKADVMATVNQFNDSMNKGDVKTGLAACAEHTSIVDEFPPYHWTTTCADWANDYDAFNKANGITEPIATFGKPKHVDITGDRAYVVVPAKYTFKHNGKRVTESGSMMTGALQKGAEGWRITGWAWSKGH